MKAKLDIGEFNGCLPDITWKVFIHKDSSPTTFFLGLKHLDLELKYECSSEWQYRGYHDSGKISKTKEKN